MKNNTLAEVAVKKLKLDILLGIFPAGSKLNIEALKKRYGIGLTPLREALHRLVSLGFTTFEGLKGFSVTALSKEDVVDLYQTRQLLECQALADAVKGGNETWEADLVAAYHLLTKLESDAQFIAKPDLMQWMQRYEQFHLALMSGSQSKWLLQLDDILFKQSERYRYAKMIKATDYETFFAEKRRDHKKLIDAVLKRNVEEAIMVYKKLLSKTVQFLINDF